MEKTFIMLKPDALERGLVGEIIARFERKGLRLQGVLWKVVSRELASRHYERLKDKPYFQELVAYMTRGPVLASIWEGENAVELARKIVGAADPLEAAPGTIRGDFAFDYTENLVHSSDSQEAAEREIRYFFENDA